MAQLGVLLAYDLFDLGYGVATGDESLDHGDRLTFFVVEEIVVNFRDVFLVLREKTVIVLKVVLID